jgi:hypothetical protein
VTKRLAVNPGDFCRRFDPQDIELLTDAINETRINVWKQQGPDFIGQTARIDADGTYVGTLGNCKEGMALSYKNIWGYHALLVSFAITQEPLFFLNRSGNRPSHEGVVPLYDKAIALCRKAGFEDILLRGDTDFSITSEFDRWTDDEVRFVFGYDAYPNIVERAENTAEKEYRRLVRKAKDCFRKTARRRRPKNVKAEIGNRSVGVCVFDRQPSERRIPGSFRSLSEGDRQQEKFVLHTKKCRTRRYELLSWSRSWRKRSSS